MTVFDLMRIATVWILVWAVIALNRERLYWKHSYLRLFDLTFPTRKGRAKVDSNEDQAL